MKKKILMILAAVMTAAMVLAGCAGSGGGGASDPTAPIREAAEGFMNAMQEGDLDKAREYADAAVFDESGLSDLIEADLLSEKFVESLGMEADKLSEESKQTLRDFGQKILDSYIQSYEISDVAEDGTVTAKVTYGFSPDAMNNIDASAVTKDLITNYTSEHMTELAEIYQKEGQEALTLKIVDDLLPDMLDALATAIDESPDATGTITLTLEETDNGWTVKKAEGDAPTSESTESTGSEDSSATSE